MTNKEKTIEALKQLGGHAYLRDIYKAFERLSGDTPLPANYKATIRATLERNSKDSAVYDGKENLFYSVDGIGNGHWGLLDYEGALELTQEDDEFCEGKLSLRIHLQRERNTKLISLAKKAFINKHNRLFCEICGFDFQKFYGDLGANFIEAHHIKPVSTMSEGESTKIEDLVMVCSNCHSMLHRRKTGLDKETLKSIIAENSANTLHNSL